MKSLQASKKMKKTKAGMIPVDWEVLFLKQFLTGEVKNGYSPNCVEEDTGRYILGLGNLTDNGLNLSKLKNVPANENNVDPYLLYDADFLISRSNTSDKVGRCALFKGEIENCYYPDLMMRFRINTDFSDKNYLEKYLQSIFGQKYFKRHASGTSGSMVKITKSVVEKTPVILPPLPEQKAISDLLSAWDEAIEKTERLVQAKEKRFKWLIHALIKERNEWAKKIGDVCKVIKGKQLNVAHMKADGAYYALNGGIKPSGRTDDWNTEAWTVTISEGGNSCGYVNLNMEKFWSGGHCFSLLDTKKSVDKHYLFFYLKMNELKLMNLRVGSGLPNIQKRDVEGFKISIPPLSEQQQIAETLSTAQQEIDLLKQLAEKYKTQKRGLMQKMLIGEWRVKSEILNKYEEK